MEWKKLIKEMLDDHLSIRIYNNDKIIYQSSESMLKPLLTCYLEKRKEMEGSIVVDKVIGLAAAFLCILAKVSRVYTPLASESAEKILAENNIVLKYEKRTPVIINRTNTGPCPMESLALSSTGPQDFLDKLLKLQN